MIKKEFRLVAPLIQPETFAAIHLPLFPLHLLALIVPQLSNIYQQSIQTLSIFEVDHLLYMVQYRNIS